MTPEIQPNLPWRPVAFPTDTGAPRQTEVALNAEEPEENTDEFQAFGEDGFTFFDFIDIVNPLQHIPIVSTLYREFTGDTLDPVPRIAGGTLFFGPIGAATSGINVFVEAQTGNDIGEHVMAMVADENEPDAGHDPGAEIAAIERPERTRTVTAEENQLFGTDSADPVTAWAAAEVRYREAEALRQGKIPAARNYSTLAKETAMAAGQDRPEGTVSERPHHMAKAADPQPAPAASPEIPELDEFLAMLGAARPTDSVPASRGGNEAGAAERKHATSIYGGATADRSETTQKSQQAATGAVAPDGGWFSAAMLNSLDHYRAAHGAFPGQPDRARAGGAPE